MAKQMPRRVFVEIDSAELNKPVTSLKTPIAELDLGKASWGGIGGSGKHAAELLPEIAEIAKTPDSFRALVMESTKLSNEPEFAEMMDLGKASWGGIGGSGKHAAELMPETE